MSGPVRPVDPHPAGTASSADDQRAIAFDWVVEAGKAHEFALACADPSAGQHGYVPLTFPEVATHFWEPPEARAGFDSLDRSRLLHGEQEIEFMRPLRIGDVLTGRTRLTDTYIKRGRRGGDMQFFVYETVFVDESGAPVVRSVKTLLERAKPG
jgi:N-terminal half of MaoC dehydratase